MRTSTGMESATVLRAVGRAVGSRIAGVNGVISSTTCSKTEGKIRAAEICFCDGEKWEMFEEDEEMVMEERSEKVVFGPVPSVQEAEDAVSTIQRMLARVPFSEIVEKCSHEQEEIKDKAFMSTKVLLRSLSTGSQSDWIEPVMHLYSSRNRPSYEREKVLDAFRLLQNNPSIQRVVISLSSDKAVWDAVMKNEAVQEFKEAFYEAQRKACDIKEDKGHPSIGILKWMQDAKARIMEVLDKIGKHLSHVLSWHGDSDEPHISDDVLRSSFMISVFVFIVVVMNRVQRS